MIQPQNITEYFINTHINPGDTVVDATMGNGNDTLKLCKQVTQSGKVYAFDIQQSAVENTTQLINQNDFDNVNFVLDSHSDMDKYVKENVKAVIFNLGYLPGGDHNIHTKAQTTIEAIKKSLHLLHDEGFVSITIYYGKNSGTDEKESVMEYLKTIDHKKYTVTVHDFYNRPNNPPLTVIITKN